MKFATIKVRVNVCMCDNLPINARCDPVATKLLSISPSDHITILFELNQYNNKYIFPIHLTVFLLSFSIHNVTLENFDRFVW